DRLAGWTVADGSEEIVLEALEPAVDEVFFRREVVEDGRLGDVRFAGDLGDADALEAALGKQPPGGLGDELPSLLLLALAQTQLRAHSVIVPRFFLRHRSLCCYNFLVTVERDRGRYPMTTIESPSESARQADRSPHEERVLTPEITRLAAVVLLG